MESAAKRRKRCSFKIGVREINDGIWIAYFLDIDIPEVGGFSRKEAIHSAIRELTYYLHEYGQGREYYADYQIMKGEEIVSIEPDKSIIEAENSQRFLQSVYLDRA